MAINPTNPFLKALKEKSESTETGTTKDSPEECGSGGQSVRLAQSKMVEDYDSWAVGAEESSLLPTLTSEAIGQMEDSFAEKTIAEVWTKFSKQNSLTIPSPGHISGGAVSGSIANQFASKTSAAGKAFGAGMSNYGSTATISVSDNLNKIQEDLRDFMTWSEKVNQRLSILTPKPELLEKYEALREAYEHYLTLERLVMNGSDESPK